MKIWLDDIREAPQGWIWCKNPSSVIDLLNSNRVSMISLDHDVGPHCPCGESVLIWLENECHENPGMFIPVMKVHSSNPVGRDRMERIIANIHEMTKIEETGTQVRFEENEIWYGQDHRQYVGVPTNIGFKCEAINPEIIKMTGHGYGVIGGNYGNGSIYVYIKDLPDNIKETLMNEGILTDPNTSVCPECHVDDFCHVEGCSRAQD